MDNLKRVLQGLGTLIAGLWAIIPPLTQLLLNLMAVDIVLGLIVAVMSRDLSSSKAWKGATKKLGALLIIYVFALLQPFVQGVFEVNLVQAATAFYVVPELLSIARNAAVLGVPVLPQLGVIAGFFRDLSGGGKKQENAN